MNLQTFLRQNADAIVRRFVREVESERLPPHGTSRSQLSDHVPLFLEEIATSLDRQAAGVSESVHGSPAAKSHGQNRSELGYDIEGLVREYSILRQCILTLASEAGAIKLEIQDFSTLARCLDVGIADSVAVYVSLRDREVGARKDELAFLTEAGEVMMSSLDLQATLPRLARLIVPRFADWCSVQVGGLAEEVLVAHVDPHKEVILRRLYEAAHGPSMFDGYPFARASGEAQLGNVETPNGEGDLAEERARREFLAAVPASSWLVVPLKAQRSLLGALVLAYGESQRRYSEPDRVLMQELARRAALALDNARLYQRSQQERLRVERALRSKDEFVAIISHELRTPLNSVLGWLTLLRTGTLSPERLSHALEVVERNAKAQARIVEDLLDISRLVTGNIRIQAAPLDLCSVIDLAIESLSPAAEAKCITVERKLDRSNAVLRGDSQRLQQVVWNLLTNAIKFTPKGGKICVSLQRHHSSLDLMVEDNGIGISQDFLPHVFEPFHQSDSTSARHHGGLGLGLAIVRHLVELHGGSIEVCSAGSGRGALFRVRLPVGLGASMAPEVARVSAATPSGDGPRLPIALRERKILIVDDDADARELVATILETAGARAVPANGTKEALELLASVDPDVIVTDLGMRQEDGFELLRRVRSVEEKSPPILALSGRASDDDRSKALLAGFDAYMTKPVEPSALVLMVAELARRALVTEASG